MKWDLNALVEAVRHRSGRGQSELVRGAVNAIAARQVYARLQYQEARTIIDSLVPKDADEGDVFDALFGERPWGAETFDSARRRAEAHLVACAESLNVTADMLAQVVYHALDLRSVVPLNPRRITVGAVTSALPSDTAHRLLKADLDSFVAAPTHVYLRDLVNTSKHRSIVGVIYAMDLIDAAGPRHGIRFSPFHYEGRSYQATWAAQFLEDEYARQSASILEIGRAINSIVCGPA